MDRTDSEHFQSGELSGFPGGELVELGLHDLANGVYSDESLLVMIAAPRLRALGLTVPELPKTSESFEHALYFDLFDRDPLRAYTKYNALIGLIVSFANAYSHLK